MTANFHTHTFLCHHADGIEREYIETAISRGIKTLGFSDHSPQIFPGEYYSHFRMRPEAAEDYFTTLRDLRDEYRDDITLYIGFEAEYYPAIFDKLIDFLTPFEPDYLILGQHFIDNEYDTRRYSGGNIDERAFNDYIDQTLEGLATGRFSCFAHPDLIRYDKDETIYEQGARRLCEGAKSLGIPLEINLLGLGEDRHYPRADFWRVAADVGNDVILGCDAHTPDAVANPIVLAKAADYAAKLGIKPVESLTLRRVCD